MEFFSACLIMFKGSEATPRPDSPILSPRPNYNSQSSSALTQRQSLGCLFLAAAARSPVMDTILTFNALEARGRRSLAVDGMFGITWFTTEPHGNTSFESTQEIERDLDSSASIFAEYAANYPRHARPTDVFVGATLARNSSN
jgi:hypothetical protein